MPDLSRAVDVVVIGAGQAGLSTAHHLARLGLGGRFVVLDGAPGAGGAWRHRWDSLTLGRAHGVHDLPGLSLGDAVGAVDADRPAAEVVQAYFAAYERHVGPCACGRCGRERTGGSSSAPTTATGSPGRW